MRRLDGLKKLTIVVSHTPVCTQPEVAFPILEQTTDAVARQTVFGGEVAKDNTIKATETALSSDPQVAIAV